MIGACTNQQQEQMMRAYGTAGGGVMFVPDEIDTVATKKSCVKTEKKTARTEKRFSIFNRRRKSDESVKKAA